MSEARGLRDLEEGRTGDGGLSLAVIAGGAGLLYANNARFRGYVDKKAGQIRTIVGRPLLPKNWVEEKDAHGNKIWHNIVTGDSSRVLPRPEPDDPDGLPENWEPHKNASGRDYYYNTKTKKSVFEKPKKEDPVKRNWIGMKKTVPPPPAPAAVRSFGYNGEPAPVHAPAATDAPVANSKAAAKAGRRAARAQQAQPVAPTSKQTQPVALTSKQQLKQAQHALELAKLHAKTANLKTVAAKRVKEQKGPKAKGTDEWAVVRTKTSALGKASSRLKELITHTEKIGALNMTHPIHKFTTLMGEVTKQERRTTAQRLKKLDTVEDVKSLKELFQQTLAALETYALLDVAKAYQLDAIRTLLSECIAAIPAVEAASA